jgi:hypothetical protein
VGYARGVWAVTGRWVRVPPEDQAVTALPPDLREAVETLQNSLDAAGVAYTPYADDAQAALALIEQRLMECPLCEHEWRRHDPEDGRCDAPAEDGLFECQCGRDLGWMQEKVAMRSLAALDSPKAEP